MKKTDTVIVGQGIAGTLVAFFLHRNNVPFIMIDPGYQNTCSRIAGGMFTPITGKRRAIHALALQQITSAIRTYKELELLLGISILHQQDIYQVYNSEVEKNDLAAKLSDHDFAKYIVAEPHALPGLKQELGACGITHSGWVDCRSMLGNFAHWLKRNNALKAAVFLYNHLQLGNMMKYQDLAFNNIIFCEGYHAINNPFFPTENIIPCSGDILTIKYDHLATEQIIKRNGIYLIPVGSNIFRAGSTYRWHNDSGQPDEGGKNMIVDQLGGMLQKDFTTIDHMAAVRPTTKNREVIAKQHPLYAGMYMLNGLGTRGVLQAPWWAKQLVDLVCAQH